MILFATGSEHKFAEFFRLLPVVKQLKLDLPEIQSIDTQRIVAAKLDAALDAVAGEDERLPLIVEDTSLSLRCISGLPGPLIKWFIQSMGTTGLAELAMKYGDHRAMAKTTIGLVEPGLKVSFFVGEVAGQIVSPRGRTDFCWDNIFQPDWEPQTYAEMEPWKKNQISHRSLAIEALKKHIGDKYAKL